MFNFNLQAKGKGIGLVLSIHLSTAWCNAHAASENAPKNNIPVFPDLLVSTTRLEKDANSAPLSAVIIQGDEIRQRGIQSVPEALAKLGQLRAVSATDGSPNAVFDLAGYGETASANTAVYLDEIRLSELDASAARLVGISPDLIERIEILTGPQSVAFGAGATGGVIRIVTKRDRQQSTGGDISVGVGSYGQHQARFSGSLVAGAWSGFVNLGQEQGHGFRHAAESQVKNGSVGFNWRNSANRIAFLTVQESVDTLAPGPLSLVQFQADPRAGKATFDGRYNAQTYSLSALRMTDFGDIAVDVSRRDKSSNALFLQIYGVAIDSRQDSVLLKHNHQFTAAGLPVSTVLGFENRQSDYFQFSSFGIKNLDQNNRAVFATLQTNLSAQWLAAVGGRRERLEKTKTNGALLDRLDSAYEASLAYQANTAEQWVGRISKAFRHANADEEPFGLSFLNTQETRTRELQYLKKHSTGQYNVRLFHARGINDIVFDPSSFNNLNIEPTRRQGIELRWDYDVNPVWLVKTLLALTDARFSQGPYQNNRVPLVSARRAALNISYKFKQQQTVDLFFNAVGNSISGSDFTNTAAKLPGYATVDLHYTQQLQKANVVLAVNNLTDRRYIAQGFYGSVYPENGRSYRVTVRYSF